MQSRFILVFVLIAISVPVLHAQQQAPARAVNTSSPTTYFQGRIERLQHALEQKNNDRTARYEQNLLAAMRQAVQDTNTPEKQQTHLKMEEILNQFNGFTFVNTSPEVAKKHVALLKEFLLLLK